MSCTNNAVITSNDEIRFTIPLPPVTKKNHGRIVTLGERCRYCGKGKYFKLLPSKQYENYARSAKHFLQTIYRTVGLVDSPVNLKCVFYLDRRRKGDLAGYLQAVQDLLVETGILADDNRNIVASVDGSVVLYDKENPRTEITVTKKEDYEQWGKANTHCPKKRT